MPATQSNHQLPAWRRPPKNIRKERRQSRGWTKFAASLGRRDDLGHWAVCLRGVFHSIASRAPNPATTEERERPARSHMNQNLSMQKMNFRYFWSEGENDGRGLTPVVHNLLERFLASRSPAPSKGILGVLQRRETSPVGPGQLTRERFPCSHLAPTGPKSEARPHGTNSPSLCPCFGSLSFRLPWQRRARRQSEEGPC